MGQVDATLWPADPPTPGLNDSACRVPGAHSGSNTTHAKRQTSTDTLTQTRAHMCAGANSHAWLGAAESRRADGLFHVLLQPDRGRGRGCFPSLPVPLRSCMFAFPVGPPLSASLFLPPPPPAHPVSPSFSFFSAHFPASPDGPSLTVPFYFIECEGVCETHTRGRRSASSR